MEFEYPNFVFESDVAQGMCELDLALGIGHTNGVCHWSQTQQQS